MRSVAIVYALCLAHGCLGSFIVDEVDMDRAGRKDLVEVYSDSAFAVFGPPDGRYDGYIKWRVAFLHDVRTHYQSVLGKLPAQRVSFYLHTAESYGHPPIGTDGRSWFDDLSVDLAPAVVGTDSVLAHELAHVLKTEVVRPGGRPFLEEGVAVFLERSYPKGYSDYPASWVPGTVLGGGAYPSPACGRPWALDELFVGSHWLGHAERQFYYYEVAGLFVEMAVERLGVRGFVDAVYVPASTGTTSDVDDVLRRAGWAPIREIETQMRVLMACP